MPGSLRISGGQLQYPSDIIVDEDISSTTEIAVEKTRHMHKHGTNFNLAIGGTPVSREELVFVADNVGTILGFHALLDDTGTVTDIDFDIKLNGVSILSSLVNITNTDADGIVIDGTISTVDFTVDDIISVEMIVTNSTGALGPFAWVDLEEGAA